MTRTLLDHAQDLPPTIAREFVATARAALAPLSRLRPLPQVAPEGRPTAVLLHGYLGHPDQLRAIHRALARAGYDRIVRPRYRSTTASMTDIAATLDRAVLPWVARGAVDLVGHSLGAVGCRAWLKVFGGARYVRRFVSLGGPHGGTRMYRLAPPNLWPILDPDGPWVQRLAEDPEPVPTTVVRCRYDHQVLPPRPVRVQGATEIVLDRVGHNGLLWSRQAHRAIVDALVDEPRP